jgi:hypothetical protein
MLKEETKKKHELKKKTSNMWNPRPIFNQEA